MLKGEQITAAITRLGHDKIAWSMFLATLAFIIVWLFPFHPVGQGLRGYAPLHTILEIFSVVIAGTIFVIGWHARLAPSTNTLGLLGIGFLGVALLDIGHLLSFNGMPDWISPSGGGKAISFWFLARYLAVFTLLVFIRASHSERFFRRLNQGHDTFLIIMVLSGVTLAGWVILTREQSLPVFLIPGTGLTPLKVIAEWVVIALSGLALYWVVRKNQFSKIYEPRTMMVSLWMMMLSELCFTLYSDATDVFNMMGHVYKVLAYAFLYQSIVSSGIKLPFRLLAQSQEMLQQLTDNIHQLFWMTTPDKSQILYMSPAFEQIWQRKLSELKANPGLWMEAIHPEDMPRVKHYMSIQGRDNNEMEYRIILPDGGIRYIHSRTFPIHNAKGELIRIAGVAEDITDKILAQEHLLRNDRLLQQAQAISHLGSWEYDVATNDLIWSDEVFRIFGISPRGYQVSYANFMACVHPDDRQFVDDCYQNSIKNGQETYECEHRIVRPENHEVRYVYEKCYHIRNEQNQVVRSIGMVHDITDRKLSEMEHDSLQRQLLQAQKMEALGHLTGGIAHDFNNMLGAILGYAELLQIKCSVCDAKQKRYIDEITVAGNRAKELITQMLAFSRLQPDTTVESDILIRPVVKEVIQLLRLSIPSTIQLNYHDVPEGLRVRINPVQLHQIIMNLAINARDAIGEYGHIDVSIEQRHFQGCCDSCHEPYDGEFVAITIRDSGKGIPEELRNKIFDPFFTTKDVGKGTGMGLSVVHGMVHSHHGHIRVKDAEGQAGTLFQILLPPAQHAPHASPGLPPQEAQRPQTDLGGLHILVVDDEATVAMFVTELLNIHGARVSTFNDPQQALETFRQNPQQFDLVISDETMPHLSGLDLARRLLQLRPGLPIILCTGYSEHVNEELSRQAGIAQLLYKPVSGHDLINLVTTLTTGRPA